MDRPSTWFIASLVVQAPHWPTWWAITASAVCFGFFAAFTFLD